MHSHGNVEECAQAKLSHALHTSGHVSHTIMNNLSSSSPYLIELRVFFDPAEYLVPEGENQVLLLRTDNEFAVPFTIDVTLEDGTAVGKYVECILPCTVQITV